MANYNSYDNTILPVFKTFKEYMPEPFIDQADADTKYVGYAHLGVGEDDPQWLIEKHITVGTVTKVLYPNSSMKFEQKWSERATLNYGR